MIGLFIVSGIPDPSMTWANSYLSGMPKYRHFPLRGAPCSVVRIFSRLLMICACDSPCCVCILPPHQGHSGQHVHPPLSDLVSGAKSRRDIHHQEEIALAVSLMTEGFAMLTPRNTAAVLRVHRWLAGISSMADCSLVHLPLLPYYQYLVRTFRPRAFLPVCDFCAPPHTARLVRFCQYLTYALLLTAHLVYFCQSLTDALPHTAHLAHFCPCLNDAIHMVLRTEYKDRVAILPV